MQVLNHTPIPHLLFERRDAADRPLGVLVLQGTFAVASGSPLRALPEQEPVHVGDAYRGDPRSTSLLRASATATFKPRSDVHVDAIARAPGGTPRADWPVRIRVGSLERDLTVLGPHRWTHRGLLGWKRSSPEPCREVPLHYELAFGGSARLDDGTVVDERRNPVGRGFIPHGIATRDPIEAAQIVAVDEPTHVPGGRYLPRAPGPIPPHFAPRTEHIGTCDDVWRRERWPCVPADFDYAHYQSAHPELVYPGYLEGGEPIQLVHVGYKGASIITSLPRFQVWALFRMAGGGLSQRGLHLDTVELMVADEDPSRHRAYLTWRCMFPLSRRVRAVEACMRVHQHDLHTSTMSRSSYG